MITSLFLLGLLTVGDDADARRLFEAGSQAYEQGRYGTAISAFEAAHKVAPRPVTAFSTAQAYRLQFFQDSDPRKLDRAVNLYREYLDVAPDGERRDVARQHLDALAPILDRFRRERGAAALSSTSAAQTQVIVSSRTPGAMVRVDGSGEERAPASFEVTPGKHRIEVSAPRFVPQALETRAVEGRAVALDVTLAPSPGAVMLRAPPESRLYVDGKPMGTAPLPGAVEVPAGHHALAVIAEGKRPFTRELELEPGQRLDLNVTLERTPQRWLAMTTVYGGVAVLVGSLGLWATAIWQHQQAARLAAIPDTGISQPSLPAELQARLGARDSYLTAGGVTSSVGVLLAATGLVLWITDRPEVPGPVITPVITPVVAPGLGGVSLSGRF